MDPACGCRCLELVQQVLAAPFDASVIQLMDDISNEVRALADLVPAHAADTSLADAAATDPCTR
jgi:hypothetical protein